MGGFTRAQLLAAVATLALALGAADCHAQFGGRGGLFGGSRGGNRDQSNSQGNKQPAQPEQDAYELTEYRLSLMEEDLHLQPGQRTAWESFADKVRAYAGDLARERARAMASPAAGDAASGGLQHIEQAADAARNHATALDDIAAAAKALYAGFTPEQIKLADLRIATIIAPPPRAAGRSNASSDNLPDLGSSGRTR